MTAPGSSLTILGLSDQMVPLVSSPQIAETFAQVDLIIGCGDLSSDYLEYALTALNKPLAYVPGNHDPDDLRVPGGDSLDGRWGRLLDLSILGFGGSPRYKDEGRHQYTQSEMTARVLPFFPRLALRRLISGYGLDLLVTHTPPSGIHDAPDPAHQGFEIFRRMIKLIRPRFMLHGHAHVHPNITVTETSFAGCKIINVFPYKLLSFEVKQTGKRSV
jgi:Icc-related predicted phosphoesterase